jgi:hypothetical protein
MSTRLKSKLEIGALIIAGLAFLDGMALLCYCPGPFVFAVPFAVAGIFLSSRWSGRLIAICLCAASLAMAVRQFERKQHFDARIKAVRAQSATNSVSE